LPRHDQTTTNHRRSVLSRVHRHGNFFQTHPNTQQDSTSNQLAPVLSTRRADGRQQREDRRDKDRSSAAEIVVHWIADPAGEERDCDVWGRVDEADYPRVLSAELAVWIIAVGKIGWRRCCRFGPSLGLLLRSSSGRLSCRVPMAASICE
jgi:hypothetical protein